MTRAEAFKQELLARLQAGPLTDYGPKPPAADNIRRSHLVDVTRDMAPAVYARFGKAKRTNDRSCQWRWEMDWTVSVYVRSDNDGDADPLLIAVMARLDAMATPYTSRVDMTLDEVEPDTEIADNDAQRVDIKGTARFMTEPWALA